MEMLPRSFFVRDPVTCARELIGCELIWGECSGIVVETEAYTQQRRSLPYFFRRSAREFIATYRAGAAYVYLNYGALLALNVV
jgi:DNA-3-methyladenine glycosylase